MKACAVQSPRSHFNSQKPTVPLSVGPSPTAPTKPLTPQGGSHAAFACAVLDSVKALSSGGHDFPHPTAYPGDSESLPSQARRPSPAPREGFLSDRPLVVGTEEQQTCLRLSPPLKYGPHRGKASVGITSIHICMPNRDGSLSFMGLPGVLEQLFDSKAKQRGVKPLHNSHILSVLVWLLKVTSIMKCTVSPPKFPPRGLQGQ